MLSDVIRKRKNILIIIGVCATLHFSISIISGIKVGYARSILLGDRNKVPKKVIESSEMTKQWIEKETKDAITFWYPVYNLSQHYPVGMILTPATKIIGRYILREYSDECNLGFEQVKSRLWAIAIVKTFINSFFFGCCLFLGWFLVHKTREKTKPGAGGRESMYYADK